MIRGRFSLVDAVSQVDESGSEVVLLVTEFLPGAPAEAVLMPRDPLCSGGKLEETIDDHRTKKKPLSLFARLRMARDIVRGCVLRSEWPTMRR